MADYASELQGKTLFGYETILDKSTARLLAFTNITSENFKRTQALALDLATALEMDLGAASLQLGKALSDPATKLSSLSRAGIAFSKEQTEVIKKLAETGDIAKAQAMILDELERKFGGQPKPPHGRDSEPCSSSRMRGATSSNGSVRPSCLSRRK